MAKYDPLYHFLVKQGGKMITLSFDDVEKIIGKKLPKSSKRQGRGGAMKKGMTAGMYSAMHG